MLQARANCHSINQRLSSNNNRGFNTLKTKEYQQTNAILKTSSTLVTHQDISALLNAVLMCRRLLVRG